MLKEVEFLVRTGVKSLSDKVSYSLICAADKSTRDVSVSPAEPDTERL